MSRIGKKPILIPDNVDAKIEGQKIIVKGPKGELSREIRPEIKIEVKGQEIFLSPQKEGKETKAFWGLFRALVYNMIKGVAEGFEKKLEIQGIGFKALVEGDKVILNVGYSHAVELEIPKDINVSVEKNIVTISGFDKELVGQVAANIRKVKPPEPYKGKGIRYLGEMVRRKVGKKVAAAG
ncbi:MAG: 50S ribosomal protein L6 [bacterium]